MNRTSIASSVVDEEAGERTADGAGPLSSARVSTDTGRCFHCGERCEGTGVAEEGKHFCCLGCRTVYALLTESGLGQFYELASTPGARVGRTTEPGQWAFLDAPAVREKLLDYADEQRAKVTLRLPAIHCVACVWLLENLHRLRDGLGESRVNFARREVSVTFAPERVRLSELAALLASLGYEPALTLSELDRTQGAREPRWRRGQWLRVGVAGFGFGNVMLLAVPGYLGLDSLSGPWFKSLAGWLSLALALPVLVYSASDFWRAAWIGLQRRVLTLDVPIALGLAAIYGRSLFEVASGSGEGYCDSLTGLIFFLLCGRLFQRKTFDRITFDRDYKGFFPLAAVRRTTTGDEPVAISELAVGDRLLIRHGELVPADARLVSGDALVDYSFVTGESEPVTRRAGEHLYAGGRQVGGAIEVATVKPVSESYLTSLWNHETFHKRRDEDLDSLTNRYSRRFTVAVVATAAGAAGYWMFADSTVAMKAFTSVLIVACPCALALAAPLTLGAAQRRLARGMVFLRNAQIIERMAEVNTIVLDKTGTLTVAGAGSVTWRGAPLSEVERRSMGSVTRHSTHPLAERITRAMDRREPSLTVRSFLETPGHGIAGRVAGRDIRMGSAAWLNAPGSRSEERAGEPAASRRPEGGTDDEDGSSVHVAIDGRYRGCFVLESVLRPEAGGLLSRLRGRYELILLSGDQPREADRFKTLFGENARAQFNQSPFDKLEAIRELRTAGRKVMMVGDGLNDAGALRQADVGVAVVERTGTFSPASDLILDAARLPRLAEVMEFSRLATRVVRAGFVVSGLYNLAGVSIAAAGMLSPLVCAVLMPLSSVTVVLVAIGATEWMARRALDRDRGARREARRSPAGSEGLLGRAATEEAVL